MEAITERDGKWGKKHLGPTGRRKIGVGSADLPESRKKKVRRWVGEGQGGIEYPGNK